MAPPHGIGTGLDLIVFGRMLAKAGHCIAVAHYGLDRFKPVLIEPILTGSDVPYFIGGATNWDIGPKDKGVWARSEVRRLPHRRGGGKRYVVVFISLYAYIGTPQYAIIVGEFISRWARVIQSLKKGLRLCTSGI